MKAAAAAGDPMHFLLPFSTEGGQTRPTEPAEGTRPHHRQGTRRRFLLTRTVKALCGLVCLRILWGLSELSLQRNGGGGSAGPRRASSSVAASSAGRGEREAEPKNLWDGSAAIPLWMKRYFAWHRSERSKLTPDNWQTKRYLILRCLRDGSPCGGASDRLGPLPYLIMLANRTNRLLFIYWTHPAPLEEFLVPPAGGMNWTLPGAVNFTNWTTVDWRAPPHNRRIVDQNLPHIVLEPWNEHAASTDRVVVEARLFSYFGSFHRRFPLEVYDERRDWSAGESTFEQVYGDVWRALFEPSPPVKARIEGALERLGLSPREYVSAHVRAQYASNMTGDRAGVKNALHCALALHPDPPLAVYLASDSKEVIRFGMDYGHRVLNRTVVADADAPTLLHLDRGSQFLRNGLDLDKHPPSAYYDTFVDLYLLSYGNCLTFGQGSYGHWASLIGGNRNCSVRHTKSLIVDTPREWSRRQAFGNFWCRGGFPASGKLINPQRRAHPRRRAPSVAAVTPLSPANDLARTNGRIGQTKRSNEASPVRPIN
jgi:hypothetical protein